MDPSPVSSQIATEIRPSGWSLEEILRLGLAVYLRNFLVLTAPALLVFAALSLVDIAFTALLGTTEGASYEAISWAKVAGVTLAGIVCAGVSLGANGWVVLRDLASQPAGLRAVLGAVRKNLVPLFTAAFFYHLAVLAPAIPGFAMLWWSMQFSVEQRILPAMGCILGGGLLLYYPLRIFLQMILFAFVVTEEGKGGWAAVIRSRRLMKTRGAGGLTGNNMFRVFIVLHVSLMPALVVLFLAFIPLIMMCVVYPLEQLIDDIQGHHISLPYLIVQALNVVVMTLIVPMFVVPLAVVYQDIRRRCG